MFGLDAADSGTLLVKGQPVRFTHPAQAVRLGLAFCPEERKADGIVGELSVRENIVLALQARAGLWPCIRPHKQRELALTESWLPPAGKRPATVVGLV